MFFFFFNDTATTEIYTLSLHDALPISRYKERVRWFQSCQERSHDNEHRRLRSEEHTSELQSLTNLVCRLLLAKKKKITIQRTTSSSETTCLFTCLLFLVQS